MLTSVPKKLLYFLLAAWALAVAAGLSFLMAGHLVAFSSFAPKTMSSLVDLQRREQNPSSWFAVHFIAEGCRCSTQVLEHLLHRGPRSDLKEIILFAGDALPDELRLSSFPSELTDANKLFRDYGVEAAPLLIVMAPDGSVVYQGGYSLTRSSPILLETLIAEAFEGKAREPLPLFGCAMTQDLQDKVDPLGLKYN